MSAEYDYYGGDLPQIPRNNSKSELESDNARLRSVLQRIADRDDLRSASVWSSRLRMLIVYRARSPVLPQISNALNKEMEDDRM